MEKNEEIIEALTNYDIQNFINEYTGLFLEDSILENNGKKPIHTKRLKELKEILGDLIDEEEEEE